MNEHNDVRVPHRRRSVARAIAAATVILLGVGVSGCGRSSELNSSSFPASSSGVSSDWPPSESHKSMVIDECFSELSAWLVATAPDEIGVAENVYGSGSPESKALYNATAKFLFSEQGGEGRNEASDDALSVLKSACKKIGSKFHSEGLPDGSGPASTGSEPIWSP